MALNGFVATQWLCNEWVEINQSAFEMLSAQDIAVSQMCCSTANGATFSDCNLEHILGTLGVIKTQLHGFIAPCNSSSTQCIRIRIQLRRFIKCNAVTRAFLLATAGDKKPSHKTVGVDLKRCWYAFSPLVWHILHERSTGDSIISKHTRWKLFSK